MDKDALRSSTQREWQQLGFFFNYDDKSETLQIHGDKAGLLSFSSLLRNYVSQPANEQLGEHDHIGPYMSFEIRTGEVFAVSEDYLQGSFADFLEIANFVDMMVHSLKSADNFSFRDKKDLSSSTICFHIHSDGFDPSTMDDMDWLHKISS